MAHQQTQDGKGVSKLKTAEEHAADRRAARDRKRRNRKHTHAAAVTTPLMAQRELDHRDLAAYAALKALEEKLANHPFALEVAQKAAASYVLGKSLYVVSKEMHELFGEKARHGLCAFTTEVKYQLTRPQTELAFA